MVEADSQLKLLPPSMLDLYKVFEHNDMLPICAVNWHTDAALISYTNIQQRKQASLMGVTTLVQQW
jgi:hypothetical protein